MKTTTLKSKSILLNVFTILFFFLMSYISSGQVGINTITPNSTLEVNGSVGQKVTAITATTTLDATYNTVVCNNTSAITVNLPAVASSACDGRIYTIKKGMSSTNDVTIDGNGSETIDGAATFVLSDVQGAITIASDGTEWKIISNHLSSYPMGEVSYFSTTGTTVGITLQTTDGGLTNMVSCGPTSIFAGMPMDFDNGGSNNGTLRYIGRTPRLCHIACTISVSPVTANDEFVFGVAKNGTVYVSSKIIQRMGATTDAQSTAMHVVIPLNYGDYLNLYVGNMVGTGDVKVKSLNLFALGM
jgi:hypothetical protein